MRLGTACVGLALGFAVICARDAAGQQAPGAAQPAPGTGTARVETQPLELTSPDRYQIPVVLEPSRRVVLVAPADGIVRSLEVAVGATVRELQSVAEFDSAEAAARLKMAQAAVKEMQAALDEVKATSSRSRTQLAQAEARLEAAKARAEIEQIAVDRCNVRAPFAGRVLAIKVSEGQYLPKGGEIAELADVSSLRTLVPVDRSNTTLNSEISLTVEGKATTGKVNALLPLPESFAPLRELAAPLTAAWVTIQNSGSALEPGQRVRSPFLPNAPIAALPARAVHEDAEGTTGAVVQVIRSEYVTNVPVRVLGSPGPERSQVTGPFRSHDVLIVSTSQPLLAGTLIRFNAGNAQGLETQAPNPSETGDVAGLTPPGRAAGVAPIGAPGSAVPRATQGRSVARPPARPAQPRPPAGSAVPF